MGDRANVVIVDGEFSKVFLYTHWGGSELPALVQTSLKRSGSRWNDAPYLTRAIFCDMVKGDEEGLTGYGISSRMCDNEHPLIVLDAKAQTVTFETEDGVELRKLSFADYCAETQPDYPSEVGIS